MRPLIAENETWTAFVPEAARWPVEVHLYPNRQVADIAGLTATARDGKTQPAEMSGGTFTITNVGVFGVDAGTPIINPGESAILAFGAVRKMPWVASGPAGDEIVVRQVTTLALSFDHRHIDGEKGSRFLADVAGILEDPATVSSLIDAAPPGVADLAARAAADGPLVSVPGGLYGFTDRTPAGWMANRGLLGVVDYYTAVMPREPAIALRGGQIFAAGGLRRC